MSNTTQDIVKRENAPAAAEEPAVLPPVDIWETEAGIDLTADLPGVPRESLSIRVDGDTLTIEGTVALGEPQDMQPAHAEVRSPNFRRSFTLSRELDSSAVRAALKDGVLRLHVPRQEAAKPRKIEVRLD